MNKFLIGLVALAAIGGVVWAQGLGGVQVPGEGPRPGFGQGMRTMGGGGSIAATDKYVYVLRGDSLVQYSVDGLKRVTETTLPPVNVAGNRGGGEGGRRNRENVPPIN